MFQPSELILNPDGSIYHLGLQPENIAHNIITVGDPKRVEMVSRYFDRIDFTTEKREFITTTGSIGSKGITVISTGIGTDNVDIVINELDALVNIDLSTRQSKSKFTQLNVIRLGTSGGIRKDVPVDSVVSSNFGVGLDNLMHYYKKQHDESKLSEKIDQQLNQHGMDITAYAYRSSPFILNHKAWSTGITMTACGFYGPQNRTLRVENTWLDNFWDKLNEIEHEGVRPTNMEMETAGIFGLCNELGHNCMSVNAILANRVNGTFSNQPYVTVDKMIQQALELISSAD
jgi:uridine phosphorylase